MELSSGLMGNFEIWIRFVIIKLHSKIFYFIFQLLWIKLLYLSAFRPLSFRGVFYIKKNGSLWGTTVPSDNRTGMENRAGVSGIKKKKDINFLTKRILPNFIRKVKLGIQKVLFFSIIYKKFSTSIGKYLIFCEKYFIKRLWE